MEPADDAVVRHYETIREEDRISEGFGQLELLRPRKSCAGTCPSRPQTCSTWAGPRAYTLRG